MALSIELDARVSVAFCKNILHPNRFHFSVQVGEQHFCVTFDRAQTEELAQEIEQALYSKTPA